MTSEKTQYAFSLNRGLHQRVEGAWQHEHAADAQAEPLHSATLQDLKRQAYSDNGPQNGNRHFPAVSQTQRVTGSMTRLGQGELARTNNHVADCGCASCVGGDRA